MRSVRRSILWLLQPRVQFSHRVFHAGFWAFSLSIVLRLFGLVRTLIVARLLAPGDFGLMGLALLMLSLIDSFTQTGFRTALVQRKGDIRPYLDTAWTIEVLRGLALAALLFLAAPLIASFFKAPQATVIIRVMAIAVLISGFVNSGVIYFEKELEFHRRFLLQLCQAVAELGVGIGLAFALKNVWALVYGALAGSVARLVASYVLHSYRPGFRLDWAKARELYNFGKWVVGSGVLVYLLLHLSDWIVGKVLGVVALGFYRMAYLISQFTTTEVTHVTSQVALPAYAKLQANQARLREAHLRILDFIAFLSFPLAGLLYFVVPRSLDVIIGEKWRLMVPAFQLLVVWGLTRSISSATSALFQGMGRPDVTTKLLLFRLLLLAALIYPLTVRYELVGTALAVVVSAFVVDSLFIYVAMRIIGGTLGTVSRILAYPFFSTLLMLLVLYAANQLIPLRSGFGQLFVFAGLGISAYALGIALSKKIFGYSAGGVLDWKLGKASPRFEHATGTSTTS